MLARTGRPGYTRTAMGWASTGRRARWVTVGLGLTAAACRSAPENPYPDEVVENFVVTCRTRADERVCQCAIDHIQRRYTLEEFRAHEARISQGEVPRELVEAVDGCRG